MEALGAMAAALAAYIVVLLIIAIIWWVVRSLAWWKIFTKAGHAGWKALIPVYNGFILTKICWDPVCYWIMLGCTLISGALSNSDAVILSRLSIILTLTGFIIGVVRNFKLSKAFGHGAGFGIGLWLLHVIFALILGFGSSEYKGYGNNARKQQGPDGIYYGR